MNIIGFMGCRSGSKGLRGKNILELGSKPLFRHALDTLYESDVASQIVFSSDSTDYLDIVPNWCKKDLRPAKLATDAAQIRDVLIEFGVRTGWDDNTYIVLIQATQPFLSLKTLFALREVIESYNSDSIITGVQHNSSHPSWSFTSVIEENGQTVRWIDDSSKESRRQDLPLVYRRAGCVYGFPWAHLLQTKSIYTSKTRFIEVSQLEAHSIDTEFDFCVADAVLKART